MAVLAVDAQAVGIIGTFVTTAALGVAALVRGGKGDKALNATSMLTATWTQTSNLIDQLQEENKKLRESVEECEKKCLAVKAAADLVLAQLTTLQHDHWKLQMELELLRRHAMKRDDDG